MTFNGDELMRILEKLTPEERAYPVVFQDVDESSVSYSIDEVAVTAEGWIFLKSVD